MRFSIIIPTYNSESNLKGALDSVLQQSFKEFEIVIIDGGSKDNTLFIANSYDDNRIIIVSEPDNGVYDAMNKGIELAKNEWIYFLGCDDILLDSLVLEKIYNHILNTSNSVIYGNVLIQGNTGWARDGEIYAGHFSKNRMLVKSICHQAIFYNRKFLLGNSLFFDLRFPVSADWHLNLRCRRISNFMYVDIIIAVFKAGGLSSTKRDSFPSQLKSEFSDLFPSKIEILIKKVLKKTTSFFR